MFAKFMHAEPKEIGVRVFVRQLHRWVSVLFVLCVIATTVALAPPKPIVWMSYLPLFPLALLALSGIYLFMLPYVSKQRAGL